MKKGTRTMLTRTNLEKPLPNPLFSSVHQGEVQWIKAIIDDRLKKSGTTKLVGETIRITPAMAEYLLENHNKKNRPISKNNVQKHVRIIREGRCLLTHQGMSMAHNGNLNNGQHRLLAIIESGISVKVFFVFGEDPEVFAVLDSHKKRSTSDVLSIAEFKNTNALAALIRMVLYLENDEAYGASLDNDTALEVAKQKPLLSDAIELGASIYRGILNSKPRGERKDTGLSQTGLCLGVYQIQKDTKCPAKLLDGFVERLTTGLNLEAKSPVSVLRTGLLNNTYTKNSRNYQVRSLGTAGAIVNAWNAHVTGGRASQAKKFEWNSHLDFPVAK